jgi:hypothetical protein
MRPALLPDDDATLPAWSRAAREYHWTGLRYMTWIDQLRRADATCAGTRRLVAAVVAAPHHLRLHGASVRLTGGLQLTASKEPER